MADSNNKSLIHSGRIVQAVIALVVIAFGVFLYWFIFIRGTVSSDDARFDGHLVDLAPEVSGTLQAVYVHEGDSIKKGQKLFELDPALFQAAFDQSKAGFESSQGALLVAQARYDRTIHGARPEEIKASAAVVARLSNEEELALLEYTRIDNLLKKGVAPQDQLDRAKAAYESAHQARVNASENYALVKKGARYEDIQASEADLQTAKGRLSEAKAALEKAQLTLERAAVYAPFDGWVVRKWLDPGAMVSIGRPVLSVFDPSTLNVEANIEERYLNRVAVGDEVNISVDAYPRLRLKGRVTQILRATQSEFSLVPAEGVSGTFIKVTQRVPLKISVNAPTDLPLGPGLSVEVRIKTGTTGKSLSAKK